MGKKARSAEKVVGNIHMLWEILKWVPLKPLVRLKCVSKQWQTLISDEQFRYSHSLHQQQHQRYPNSLIFSSGIMGTHILSITTTTTTPSLRVLNLDFLNILSTVTLVGSCNGLLLCHTYDCTTYFICNPITRHFTTLNLRRHPFRAKSRSIHLYLVYDPSISPRYKVVSVVTSLNSQLDWVFHVYTFKTRSRIGHAVSVSIPFALDAAKGVYCNGAIHWFNRGEFSVYFDVDNKCLKNYPMPLSSSGSKWFELPNSRIHYFGESGGHLHVMLPAIKEIHNNNDSFVYDLFELKEDYSGWSLRYRVDLNPLQVDRINRYWTYLRFFIFCMAKDTKKKSSMLVLIVGDKGAIFYDPVDKTSRKFCDFEMDTKSIFLGFWGRVFQHFENLHGC